MVAYSHQTQPTLHDRVSDYLSNSTGEDNTFVAAAEATEVETARVVEAEMNEYLLERAIQELRAAQDKVDKLRKEIEEKCILY